MAYTISYGQTSLRDLAVVASSRSAAGKLNIRKMAVANEEVTPTPRFWRSFFVRFGVADTIFRYFEPAEVFERIAQRASDAPLRYCIERDERGGQRLLAVSNPLRPVIRHGETLDLVQRFGAQSVDYADGIVTSVHTPGSGERPFTIGGDRFEHQFVMETPIDGFSHPKIYLSYLRTVCSNGMVGYGRAFRSDLSLGKDMAHCISRALEGFDNGEGYAALRQRFESAQNSWASVCECSELCKTLVRLSDGKSIKADQWLADFHRMTGNLNAIYGLANLDAISRKRQRVLPARCRVYDLLNFASEMATHRASTVARRSLQAFIGTMISDEYDMEGTAKSVTDFTDFLTRDDNVNASLN